MDTIVAAEPVVLGIDDGPGPGSTLAADYFDESVIDGSSPLPEAQVLRQFVESEGAPLQFGINTDVITDFFKQRGFSEVTQESPSGCKQKFFPEASQSRSVSSMFNFVQASLI